MLSAISSYIKSILVDFIFPFAIMDSQIVSSIRPLPPSFLQQLALSGSLDEISNFPGAVRHHIFYHGKRDKTTNKLFRAMLFFIYQTSRHGPQNGFRLCLVHDGFHIASATKTEGGEEDEIDKLEKEIPNGHMEVVILGKPLVMTEDKDESEDVPLT